MNSVRICWRRRSSETSSRTSQAPPDDDRRARTSEPRPIGSGTRRSRRSPNRWSSAVARDGLDLDVQERLDQRSGRPASPAAARGARGPRRWRRRSAGPVDRRRRPGRATRSAGRGRGGSAASSASSRPFCARSADDRARPDRAGCRRSGDGPDAAAPVVAARTPASEDGGQREQQRRSRRSHASMARASHSDARASAASGAASGGGPAVPGGRAARGRGRHGAVKRVERGRREGMPQDEQVRQPRGGPPGPAGDRRADIPVRDGRCGIRSRRAPRRRAGASSSSGERPGRPRLVARSVPASGTRRQRRHAGRVEARQPAEQARTAAPFGPVAGLADGCLPAAGQALAGPRRGTARSGARRGTGRGRARRHRPARRRGRPGAAGRLGRQPAPDLGFDGLEGRPPVVGQEPPDRGAEGDRGRIGAGQPVELVGRERRDPVEEPRERLDARVAGRRRDSAARARGRSGRLVARGAPAPGRGSAPQAPLAVVPGAQVAGRSASRGRR